jgi:FkbM family methyltransferase
MRLHDGTIERQFWHALRLSENVVGPLRARALAAIVMRMQSRTERGYVKSMYRVARHTSSAPPDVVRLPEQWSSGSPLVRVKRLGVSLDLDLRDNLQRLLYYAGTYEPGVVRFIERELQRGDTFMDVGAHIGVHSLVAARRLRDLGAGRVIAFEPTEDSAEKIRRAAARNRLDLTVVEAGLSDARGTAELRTDPDYGLEDAGVRSQYGSGQVVQQIPLMTFDAWANEVGLQRLDVVKIDVEGAEPRVLAGMQESLARLRPRSLVVELKATTLERADTDGTAVRRLLDDAGYTPVGQPLLFHNQVFLLCPNGLRREKSTPMPDDVREAHSSRTASLGV